jgi:hypothetical protein
MPPEAFRATTQVKAECGMLGRLKAQTSNQ